MKRVFVVSEDVLKEADPTAFNYIDSNDGEKPYMGQTEINVSGKMSDGTDGEPSTGDKVARMLTPQAYYLYRMYRNVLYPHRIREGVNINDKNNDNVDDFYNHDELDVLGNGDEMDDLTRIPQGIIDKSNLIIDNMSSLNAKQKAIVLNKFIEELDLSSIPYGWKKELSMKIINGSKQES